MTEEIRKIYVRSPNHLGDVVMVIPAIRRIAERHPGARIDVWCPVEWTPILEMAELGAAAIPFRRARRFRVGRLVARLRKLDYDLAYLFTPSFRTAAITWLARIPRRRGSPTDGRGLLLNDRTVREEEPGEHRTSFYLRIADPEWPGGMYETPQVRVSELARREFRRLVGRRLKRPIVGVCAGAHAPARQWPLDRFVALAAMLAGEVGTVLAFGGATERNLSCRIAEAARERGIDVGGRTSPSVLAAGLAECEVVITNDSGPMHLAAAVGTGIVAVFGASDLRRTGPVGVPSRILQHSGLPCVPCYRNRCPRRGPGTFLPDARDECLHLISVESVAHAARELVGSARVAGGV